MPAIFYTRAVAIDAVCRVAFLIVFVCVLLVSVGASALKMVPGGWGWFGYRIGLSALSILPVILLARNSIIVDMIDITFYDMLFFGAMALAATGTAETYQFFAHVLDPVVTSFLFYLTLLRLLWLPVFKVPATQMDWPPIGLLGLLMRHRIRRVVVPRQVAAIILAIVALIPISVMVGKLKYGWVCLGIGSTGLFLVARYWPVFIDLLGNTIDDRTRLAHSMEAAANELTQLKQALAEQAVVQAATMDEASAQLMLDEVVTPAGHDMLRQISQVHPGIRKELIVYILDVCKAARLEKLRLVGAPP